MGLKDLLRNVNDYSCLDYRRLIVIYHYLVNRDVDMVGRFKDENKLNNVREELVKISPRKVFRYLNKLKNRFSRNDSALLRLQMTLLDYEMEVTHSF